MRCVSLVLVLLMLPIAGTGAPAEAPTVEIEEPKGGWSTGRSNLRSSS